MDLKPISISRDKAALVARQVWLNETGGDRDTITAWNASEDFASLGIGHFIWFPAGLNSPFDESFPEMLQFLRQRGATLPGWLDKSPIPACPWTSKARFDDAFHSPRMVELRRFLLQTMDLQAQFLVHRLQKALPGMLASLQRKDERRHLIDQFYRIVAASPDLYPLIDYVNFKGEGTKPSEAFPNSETGVPEGWGLKHVLLKMQGKTRDTDKALAEFSDAARLVLLRRIENNPRDKRWQKNWMRRADSYRRPLR